MQAQNTSQLELHRLVLPLTVCLLVHRHAPDCMHAGQVQTMVGTVCANATGNTSKHQMHTNCCEGRVKAKQTQGEKKI